MHSPLRWATSPVKSASPTRWALSPTRTGSPACARWLRARLRDGQAQFGEAFGRMDGDGDGAISGIEFGRYLAWSGLRAPAASVGALFNAIGGGRSFGSKELEAWVWRDQTPPPLPAPVAVKKASPALLLSAAEIAYERGERPTIKSPAGRKLERTERLTFSERNTSNFDSADRFVHEPDARARPYWTQVKPTARRTLYIYIRMYL